MDGTGAVRGRGLRTYGRKMRALHWSTAALLLGPYLTIWAIGHVASDVSAAWLAMLHRSFGIVLLALTLSRLVVRNGSVIPPLPPGLPRAQHVAAKLNVIGLYGLLIAQPLLGLAGTMLHGDRATVFGTLVLPAVLPVDRKLGRALFLLHGWAGHALLGLISLHVLAALHHHFMRGDTVLTSMLPPAWNLSVVPRATKAPIRGGLS